MKNEEGVDLPSSFFIRYVEAPAPLFILRLVTHLNHLAPTVGSAALADMMRAHQLAALRARHQGRGGEPLMLAAIAAAVTRNFGFWYGTHVDKYSYCVS